MLSVQTPALTSLLLVIVEQFSLFQKFHSAGYSWTHHCFIYLLRHQIPISLLFQATLGLMSTYLMPGLLWLSLNGLPYLNFLCHVPSSTLLTGFITPWLWIGSKSFLWSKRYRVLVFTSVASEPSWRIPYAYTIWRHDPPSWSFSYLISNPFLFMLFFSPGSPTAYHSIACLPLKFPEKCPSFF